MRFTILCVFALLLPSLATAQSVTKAVQLVGFSSETLPGDLGMFDMTLQCQANFPASRMCTSEEALATFVAPPQNLGVQAWIQPSLKPVATAGTGATVTADASGLVVLFAGDLSCHGWRRSSGSKGLTISQTGRFEAFGCNELHSIACCSLIPVPEPPLSLLQGGAAAGLGAIAAKKRLRGQAVKNEPAQETRLAGR